MVLAWRVQCSYRQKRKSAYTEVCRRLGAMLSLSSRNNNNYAKRCRTWLVMLPMSYTTLLFAQNSPWLFFIRIPALLCLWRKQPSDKWLPAFNFWDPTLNRSHLSNNQCWNGCKGPSSILRSCKVAARIPVGTSSDAARTRASKGGLDIGIGAS